MAHDGGEAEGRDIDPFDLIGLCVEGRDSGFERVEGGVNGIAAGPQAQPVARDLPARAELVEQVRRVETVANEMGQRFLDRQCAWRGWCRPLSVPAIARPLRPRRAMPPRRADGQ